MIFAVAKIRNFSETTECLLDQITLFVNKIVKIVHECTKRWDAVPSNNLGDKYILTWKLPQESDCKSKFGRTMSGRSITSDMLNDDEKLKTITMPS